MSRPAHYCIRIRDHLNTEWSDWFEQMHIEQHEDGTTTLSGMVADQAALYGLLDKLRDLGLELISVDRTAHGGRGSPPTGGRATEPGGQPASQETENCDPARPKSDGMGT